MSGFRGWLVGFNLWGKKYWERRRATGACTDSCPNPQKAKATTAAAVVMTLLRASYLNHPDFSCLCRMPIAGTHPRIWPFRKPRCPRTAGHWTVQRCSRLLQGLLVRACSHLLITCEQMLVYLFLDFMIKKRFRVQLSSWL